MGNDLRYAFRTLTHAPLVSVVAILSLALGIGANTAIFSLLHQVLLRSLPVQDSERIALLHFEGVRNGTTSSDSIASVWSYPMYRELRDRNRCFTGLIARSSAPATVIFNQQAEQARAEIVSGNFFKVLGVRPALGRLLTSADDVTPGGHPIALLSYGYWTRRFGAAPSILNQTVRVNGLNLTVVGVTPRNFLSVISGQSPDIYVPIAMRALMNNGANDLAQRDSYWLSLFARLRPDMTLARAQASLAPIFRGILDQEAATLEIRSERFRRRFLANRLTLEPAAEGVNQLRKQWEKPLLVVMGMVGLVLLIACANVANLLMARAAARRREVAIRLAIGAGRARLVRQFLVESLLLACAGGLLGLMLTHWITRTLIALVSEDEIGGWLNSSVDLRLLAFTFAVSIVTGLLFGLAPALSATRPDVVPALKDFGATVSRGHPRFRRSLVSAQVALSLVLLIAAGLLVRSFTNLLHFDLGFRTDRLFTFALIPVLSGYKNAATVALLDRLRERLAALPGVSTVSACQFAPLGHNDSSTNVTVEGYRAGEDENTDSEMNGVSPGYFRALGIPLIAGREFTPADTAQSPKVTIINQAFADRFFRGRNPLGLHITPGSGNVTPDIEVVGVVRNFKHSSVREQKSPLFYFRPYAQQRGLGRIVIFVRSARQDAALPGQVRNIVHELDPNLPVTNPIWMPARVEETVYIDHLIAWLAGGFGLLAMLLAAIGLYGVIAYMVARRTFEIGIRMALGASRRRILWLVLREVSMLLAIGLAAGIPCAWLASGYLESQLFGIHAGDPGVIASAVAVLALAAFLPGYLPARRAASVDPLEALRYE
jgi:predicted permease